MYQIWTDGACKGNPGPGGCAYLTIDQDGNQVLESFHEPDTTNNRMELAAAIFGLASVPTGSTVTLTTDSEYVRQGITNWIHNWKKKNWKTAKGKPVKNQDLWQLLDKISSELTITWNWVKGHSDDPFNDAVDKAASEACYAE